MQNIKVKISGNGAVLMHSNKGANPLSKEAKGMKDLQSKKKKTDSDYMALARMDWESGLYLNDGVVVMPAQNIEKCFIQGARRSKNGKQFEGGVLLKEDYCPMEYRGTKIKTTNRNGVFPDPQLDNFCTEHSWQEMVKIGKNQVLRTRPIFYEWSCEATIMFDENILNERVLYACAVDAGNLIGLCEKRPKLGRFSVTRV